MRFSEASIERLQALLKEHCDLNYSDEQAQEAGISIMRFVIAKGGQSENTDNLKENEYGNKAKQVEASAYGALPRNVSRGLEGCVVANYQA